MLQRLALCAAASLLAATSAGCLFSSTGERIVRPDEGRRTVAFESEQAMIDFQSAARLRDTYGARRQGEHQVAIPFILLVDETRVLSESAFYNDQIAAADLDGDGTLTDAEVRAYCEN